MPNNTDLPQKPKKMEKFKIDCKQLVADWLRNSSSHGLQNSSRAKNKFIKLVWLLMFCVLLVTCCWCAYGSWLDYARYRTTVSIEYVRESPTQFPAVTFCNLNPFNQSHAKYMFKRVFEDSDLKSCIDNNSVYDKNSWDHCINGTIVYKVNSFAKIVKRRVLNANLTDEDRVAFGFQLDDMLKDCEFNGMPCYANEFTQFWHNEYGNCYTFNSGKHRPVLLTNKVGSSHGLKLELIVNNSERAAIKTETV
jgi:hypothetical protein